MKQHRLHAFHLAFVLILCTMASQAQVIDWQGYCTSTANNSVVLSIAGFTGKAERFKSSATDADSQLFKEMVKVCRCVLIKVCMCVLCF